MANLMQSIRLTTRCCAIRRPLSRHRLPSIGPGQGQRRHLIPYLGHDPKMLEVYKKLYELERQKELRLNIGGRSNKDLDEQIETLTKEMNADQEKLQQKQDEEWEKTMDLIKRAARGAVPEDEANSLVSRTRREEEDLERIPLLEQDGIDRMEAHDNFRPKYKKTFMNMGEKEPMEEEGMLPTDDDELPTLAHMELEQHREMRHYARLTAWEMPLLADLAKPFEPPTADMPLRFRYTSYMGEKHPAEKKVVLEFSPADMPNLTDIQRLKLKKLVGNRYNPEADIVKMSCEMFPTKAQNKRYLGDLVDTLLKESREGDMFEDIPLNTRHHTFKNNKPQFPKEWKLTEQRRAELERQREEAKAKDQNLAIEGKLVDGVKFIEEGLMRAAMQRAAEPDLVIAPKAGKRVAVRR